MTDNDDLLRLVKLASSGDNEALSLLVSKMIPDVRREASKFSGAVGRRFRRSFSGGYDRALVCRAFL